MAAGETARIQLDTRNPGHFFAACGLLELADRSWRGAEGWFDDGGFCIAPLDRSLEPTVSVSVLLANVARTHVMAVDPADETASPLELPGPFDLRLDWWKDSRAGGDRFKAWAGRMSVLRIASAMCAALARVPDPLRMFDYGEVVYDVADPSKKVEPFYFDARRGSNARPLDVGFAPDALGLTNVAYPAVEFLALVGLQRARPAPTSERRTFDYATWTDRLTPILAACAAAGLDGRDTRTRYRFQVAFRTDQRKHKAFMPATAFGRTS